MTRDIETRLRALLEARADLSPRQVEGLMVDLIPFVGLAIASGKADACDRAVAASRRASLTIENGSAS